MLPREYPPPWQTVYYHFRKWRLDGRLRQAHDRLRKEVREVEGRARDPSGAVIDSQAVKGTGVGGPERGYDGAKRLSGRKRHLLVDTSGLVLGTHVHAASLHDRDGAQGLLTDELKKELPRLELLWALTARTRTSSAGGPKKSEGGRSRYRTIATGGFGATGWRKSRAGSGCCPGGGWSREPSRG